jgi:hypothetical protein
MTVFYFLRFETPPILEGWVPVLISPGNRVAQLYPQTLGSLSSPPTTHRATVEVFEPASTVASYISQSQSYIMTGGLPPINSSSRQAPWGLRSETFLFPTEPSRLTSLCNTLSDEKIGLSVMNTLGLVKCTYLTCSVLLKILPFALYTSPQSVQALQSRSCLSHVSYLLYNGSLVTWTVISLTTANFKPIIFFFFIWLLRIMLSRVGCMSRDK